MKRVVLFFICSLFLVIYLPHHETEAASARKICIDPGHQQKSNSGKEPNAPGSSILKTKVSSGTAGKYTRKAEYVVVLEISKKLKTELQDRGYSVYMTRTTHNVNLSNIERAQYCNSVKADLTLRIHADGSTNQKHQGIHVLYPSGNVTKSINKESEKAAKAILNELINSTGAYKANGDGLSPRTDITGFNWSKYPVVLPELGFMSNIEEDKKLSNEEYQWKLAKGMANGVDDYFDIDRTYLKLKENATIYDNRADKLIKVGKLAKGQIYPFVSEYGNWYKIKFSDYYGYIKKNSTTVVNTAPKNENISYKNSKKEIITVADAKVYDNSSGKLVPFATIEKNKKYNIISDYGSWYRIDVAGRIGYINKNNTALPNYFKVGSLDTPVYDNRSGNLVKVGTLEANQVFPRVSDYGNWHRIKFADHYGYVKKADTTFITKLTISNENKTNKKTSRNFVAVANLPVYDNSSGKLIKFATIEEGKQYPIISDYGNWFRIDVAGRIGYISKGNTAIPDYFKVKATDVAVYDNRSGKLVKVGTLKAHQVFPRVSDYGNWHKIDFAGHFGYIKKEATTYVNSISINNENNTYRNTSSSFSPNYDLTVYDNTSGKLVPFATIEKGNSYPIISNYGSWYRVDVSGRIGYVNKKYVY